MQKGQAFVKYNYEHVTEKTSRESVFYLKDSTSLGSLYIIREQLLARRQQTAELAPLPIASWPACA